MNIKIGDVNHVRVTGVVNLLTQEHETGSDPATLSQMTQINEQQEQRRIFAYETVGWPSACAYHTAWANSEHLRVSNLSARKRLLRDLKTKLEMALRGHPVVLQGQRFLWPST